MNTEHSNQFKARLLYVEGCHAYHQAFDELIKALVEAEHSPHLEAILVRDNEEAATYHFFGSPAVHIDGIDVDPRAAKVTDFKASSCRPYLWEGESYDYPPKGMILSAFNHTS